MAEELAESNIEIKSEERDELILTHVLEPHQVRRGDHLRVFRKLVLYTHHGIAVGGEDVKDILEQVNFMRTFRKKPKLEDTLPSMLVIEQHRDGLCVVTFEEFADGNKLRLVKYGVSLLEKAFKHAGSCYREKALPIKEIIERATEQLLLQYKQEEKGEKTNWSYDLLAKNCETFALYCTGINKTPEDVGSLQVNQLFLYLPPVISIPAAGYIMYQQNQAKKQKQQEVLNGTNKDTPDSESNIPQEQ